MGLIERIKSALGLGETSGSPATADAGTSSGSGEVDVTVEHEPEPEPATANEDAVKGTDTSSNPTTADRGGDTGDGSDDGEQATAPEADLQDIKGIGPTYAERLREAGVESVADLAGADPDALHEKTDIGPNRLSNWIDRARAR